MWNKWISYLIVLVSLSLAQSFAINNLNAEELFEPEKLTKRITLQPSIIKWIEEDDVKTALKKLNELHSRMADEGWILYETFEYIDGADFEGFFATYIKKKRLNNTKQ